MGASILMFSDLVNAKEMNVAKANNVGTHGARESKFAANVSKAGRVQVPRNFNWHKPKRIFDLSRNE